MLAISECTKFETREIRKKATRISRAQLESHEFITAFQRQYSKIRKIYYNADIIMPITNLNARAD